MNNTQGKEIFPVEHEYYSLMKESNYQMETLDTNKFDKLMERKFSFNEKNYLGAEDDGYMKINENNPFRDSFSNFLNEDNFSKGFDDGLLLDQFEREANLFDITKLSLYLGCMSFGGPMAHQQLFYEKFVKENKFISDRNYRHILSLSLILPGYSSSTFLAAISAVKMNSIFVGYLALLIFNLPSLIVILLCGFIIKTINTEIHSDIENKIPDKAYFTFDSHPYIFVLMVISSGILQGSLGLMVHSAHVLSKKLSNSVFQTSLLVFSGLIYFFIPNFALIVVLIILSGILSLIRGDHDYLLDQSHTPVIYSKIKFTGTPCLILFCIIYSIAYAVNYLWPSINGILFESFYRIGSLSIGEGHVIIPMILTEFTNKKLVEEAEVLNGYALTSLLPGSMFNISAYTGVICHNVLGGIISGFSIFLPGSLFIFTALPHINKIKSSNHIQFFIRGANSAAIGFLYTAAIKLWIDSCFVNPYTNPISGSLNVLTCYILVEAFKLHKLLVILFGGVFMLIFTQAKIFFNDFL